MGDRFPARSDPTARGGCFHALRPSQKRRDRKHVQRIYCREVTSSGFSRRRGLEAAPDPPGTEATTLVLGGGGGVGGMNLCIVCTACIEITLKASRWEDHRGVPSPRDRRSSRERKNLSPDGSSLGDSA